MISEEKDLKEVIARLSWWVLTTSNENAVSFFDGNKVAERFMLSLLNLLFYYELRDLNEIKVNFPGLDLGDETKSQIAFQVTSRTDSAKIIKTLKTVVKNKHEKIFVNGIRFLILKDEKIVFKTAKTDPQKVLSTFDPSRDIIYQADLIKQISFIYKHDYARFLEIKTLVEREIRFPTPDPPDPLQILMPAIQSLERQLSGLLNVGKSQVATAPEVMMGLKLPKLSVLSERQEVITGLREILTEASAIWLSGEVATGKTHAAYLLAKTFENNIYWLDSSESSSETWPVTFLQNFRSELKISPLGNSLEELYAIVAQLPADSVIVLNDIPQLPVGSNAIRFLSELISGTTSNGHTLIITSNFTPNISLSEEFEGMMYHASLPPFTEEETGELLLAYHAPQDELDRLKKVTNFVAEGHPLIINAIAKYLKDTDWKIEEQTLESLFRNTHGLALNKEIYSRLINSTADEQTRELLYRLKLVIGNISNDDIAILSSTKPVINHADERISSVTGTWIQATQKLDFQLSPLIKRVPENIDTELRKKLLIALADGQLKKKTLSPFDAAKAIQYFNNAGLMQDAALVLLQVAQKFQDHPHLFLDYGFGLYWYYTELPKEVDPLIKVNIRFYQIHIALELKDDVEFLKADLLAIQTNEITDTHAKGLISLSLFRLNAEKHPMTALQNLIDAQNSIIAGDPGNKVLDKDDAFLTHGIWVTFYKLTPNQYHDWFTQVSKLGLGEIYDPIANPAYIAAGPTILAKIIASKYGLNADDKIGILQSIIKDSLAAKMNLIAAYALKYLVYVYFVEKQDAKMASQVINDHDGLLKQHEIYRFLVIDEFGRHLFDAGNTDQARRQMESINDVYLPSNYSEKPGSLRAFTLMLDDDPESAHEITIKALEVALKNRFNSDLERVWLYGEVGISYWLKGDLFKAVEVLEEGYNLLDKTYIDSEGYHAAIIRYGSIGQYIIRLMIDGKPPVKAFNGPYMKPARGDFYRTNEDLLAGGFFFEERRFIVPFIFQEAFEHLGHELKAKKWGLIAIKNAVGIKNAQFLTVLQKNLFYLVQEGDFDHVFSVYNFLNQATTIEGRGGKVIDDDAKARSQQVSDQIRADDTIFYELVFIPIIYQIILQFISIKPDTKTRKKILNDLFESSNLKAVDNDSLLYIKSMLNKIWVDGISISELDQLLLDYKGKYGSQLNLIGTLAYSYIGTAKEAAELQLATIQRQEQVFSTMNGSGLRFFLIPFYEKFWTEKFNQFKKEFQDNEFWDKKSFPYFKEADWSVKLKRLFKVLIHHLNIKTVSAIDTWIDS